MATLNALQGLTIENFTDVVEPVFLDWLTAGMKKADTSAAFDWIRAVYNTSEEIGETITEYGDLGTMPKWLNRQETENAAITDLPIPDYVLQYFEQWSAEFPVSKEYLEQERSLKKRERKFRDYVQMLAKAGMDTRAALAFVPFADAFDGNFYTTTDGLPLCSTHTLPGGTYTNASTFELSPTGLDAMNDAPAQVFTDQGMPVSYTHDFIMVGDRLKDTALDIVTASGDYAGNQNVRNRYSNLSVVVNPFMRDEILTNGDTMWFGFSLEELTFEEIYNLSPEIETYYWPKNLTYYVRGRMGLQHLWKSVVGVWGSTGTTQVS
jgi:hypothetical protein